MALISDDYRDVMRRLHVEKERFGTSSPAWAAQVVRVINFAQASSILDYGCGKGLLKGAVLNSCPQVAFQEYDPGIPEKAWLPVPADVVVAIDVLEHIEPDCAADVLDHLRSLARKYLLVTIAVVEANRTLPDGRNAHVLLRSGEWWLEQLRSRFAVLQFDLLEGKEYLAFCRAVESH